jgi:hypothetical protein
VASPGGRRASSQGGGCQWPSSTTQVHTWAPRGVGWGGSCRWGVAERHRV